MIAQIWSGKNKLYWLLLPLSLLYGLIVALRRFAYRQGFFRAHSISVPVMVIGNLSVGGNGKTPLTIAIAKHLIDRGFKVGIISRGYGGKNPIYPFIVDASTSAKNAGDEPVLMFNHLHCPISIAPDRVAAAQFLLEQSPEINVILSDDGLQHYRLKRDIEIVVIDGNRGLGNGHYLPAGPLRETQKRLKTVDFVVFNGENKTALKVPNALAKRTFQMNLIAQNAINLKTAEIKPVCQIKPLIACAGIGDPARFFTTLRHLNADVIMTHSFRDHHAFTSSELSSLVSADQSLIMTEKDAVKCAKWAQANWWFLPVQAQLPKDFFAQLIDALSHTKQ